MTVTKADIAAAVSQVLGIQQQKARAIVNEFFEEIRQALDDGESVKLSGFGNFALRQKNSRPGRNPKTGVEVSIPPRKVVTFKAGQKLKQQISSQSG